MVVAPRIDLIDSEFERIERYTAKGDIVPLDVIPNSALMKGDIAPVDKIFPYLLARDAKDS